jgi:hypothetical protein
VPITKVIASVSSLPHRVGPNIETNIAKSNIVDAVTTVKISSVQKLEENQLFCRASRTLVTTPPAIAPKKAVADKTPELLDIQRNMASTPRRMPAPTRPNAHMSIPAKIGLQVETYACSPIAPVRKCDMRGLTMITIGPTLQNRLPWPRDWCPGGQRTRALRRGAPCRADPHLGLLPSPVPAISKRQNAS